MARIFSGLRTQLVDFPNLPTDVFFCTDTKQAFLGNAPNPPVEVTDKTVLISGGDVIPVAGPPGSDGSNGSNGAQGPQGIQGMRGEKGQTGDPGCAGEIPGPVVILL